jgi:hypothetical protein
MATSVYASSPTGVDSCGRARFCQSHGHLAVPGCRCSSARAPRQKARHRQPQSVPCATIATGNVRALVGLGHSAGVGAPVQGMHFPEVPGLCRRAQHRAHLQLAALLVASRAALHKDRLLGQDRVLVRCKRSAACLEKTRRRPVPVRGGGGDQPKPQTAWIGAPGERLGAGAEKTARGKTLKAQTLSWSPRTAWHAPTHFFKAGAWEAPAAPRAWRAPRRSAPLPPLAPG